MIRAIVASIVLASAAGPCVADLKVGSWNIERLGQKTGKSMSGIARVASSVDFLSIQELMSTDALSELEKQLEKQTSQSWSVMASDAVGRGNYHEMYAFAWRDSKVEYVDGAVIYLDSKDVFSREPYSARFKDLAAGTMFVASTVHILYGKSEKDRIPEIQALSAYWAWLQDVYANEANIMLMGDFNLPYRHVAFEKLKVHATPLILKGASTLSPKNNRYANLFDNIWLAKTSSMVPSAAGVLRYPQMLGLNHYYSRSVISDHAPVVAVFQ